MFIILEILCEMYFYRKKDYEWILAKVILKIYWGREGEYLISNINGKAFTSTI